MTVTVDATYQNGTFKAAEPVSLPEGAKVRLVITIVAGQAKQDNQDWSDELNPRLRSGNAAPGSRVPFLWRHYPRSALGVRAGGEERNRGVRCADNPGAAFPCPYCGILLGFDENHKTPVSGWPVIRYGMAELQLRRDADGEPSHVSLADWRRKHRWLEPGTHYPLSEYSYAEQAPADEIVP
jgi:predicted DNA-binding antitoxin AbrB/MazE fold protein